MQGIDYFLRVGEKLMKYEPACINESPCSHATARFGIDEVIHYDHGRQ
jgi:hypothetical protein